MGAVTSTQVVFAEEYMPHCDARRFVVCDSPKEYVPRFLNTPPHMRRVHEIFQFDRPCRLVFDVESTSADKDDREKVSEAVQKIIGLVGPDKRVVVLDSSREVRKNDKNMWKSSYHITFPDVVLESPAHVAAYAQELLVTTQDFFVDMSIYRVRGSLRTAYSRSFRSDAHLVPLGLHRDAPVDVDVFLSSLATVPGAAVTTVPAGPVLKRSTSGTRATDDKYHARARDAIERYLLEKFYDVGTLKIDANCNSPHPEEVSVYVGGIKCPFRRATHHSNRMLFTVTLIPEAIILCTRIYTAGEVRPRWRCLDEDCKGRVGVETEDVERRLAAEIYME